MSDQKDLPPGVRKGFRLPASAERLDQELDEEIAFHMEARVSELIAKGMSPEDARNEAQRRFGDREELRNYVSSIEVPHMQRVRFVEWFESLRQDIRIALRQFSHAPGFVLVAALTLALGVGVSTAIFSVVRGVLLRPLPYAEPEHIVQLWQQNDQQQSAFSDPNYEDVRDRSRSFAAIAQLAPGGVVSVSGLAEPVRAQAAFVSRDFFAVMRMSPTRGRIFTAEEATQGGATAVVISNKFWVNALDGSDDALGKRLTVDGQTFSVVGILPSDMDYPGDADLWAPREIAGRLPSRTAHNWQVIARLRDGVSLDQARTDVSGIARQLKQLHGSQTRMSDVAVVPLQEQLVGRTRQTLLLLLAGSLLLLLIACANVVNLLIARMAGRQTESALRIALGAGRWRLAQQHLVESAMLATTAAVIAVPLAYSGIKALLLLAPANLPRLDEIRVDGQVLAFALGVSALAALVMGMIAAFRGDEGDLRAALAQSQRTQGGSVTAQRARRGLVVAQVAMAVVLLVGAGLFARSFVQLLRVDTGFDIRGQVVLEVMHAAPLRDRVQVYDELLRRFRALPGVTQAGGVAVMPLAQSSGPDGTFIILSSLTEQIPDGEGARIAQSPDRIGEAEFRVAGPGYFEAMGVPLRKGRSFEDRDAPGAPHVALISESLAEARWPGTDPIGKIIQFGNMDGDRTPITIVGVVGDVRESLAGPLKPTFYVSYRQRPNQAWRFSFVLATSTDPAAIMNPARAVVRAVRPEVPPRVRAMEGIMVGSIADRRFVLTLIGVFGAAALLLAALGVYSVISYLVSQREREIGIRVALGARSQDILGMVLKQGLSMALAGIVVGAALSLAAARLVEKMLWGVSGTDSVAFGGVVATLVVVSLLASWIPARRAARVQAMDVMRVG
jgi:putative ABC transport system permease protein